MSLMHHYQLLERERAYQRQLECAAAEELAYEMEAARERRRVYRRRILHQEHTVRHYVLTLTGINTMREVPHVRL